MKRKRREKSTAGKARTLMPDYQDKCRSGHVIEWSRIEENEDN